MMQEVYKRRVVQELQVAHSFTEELPGEQERKSGIRQVSSACCTIASEP